MKKSYFLALGAVALIGCGGDDDKKADMASTDMAAPTGGDMAQTGGNDGGSTETVLPCTSTTCTAVTGFSVDIDKLSAYYAMNPNASAGDIIQNSCVPGTPVYAKYEGGGITDTVTTDTAANFCAYSINAQTGKTIHLVAAENAATAVINTYSQDKTVVSSTASNNANVPAHVCTSNQYSAPVGVAKTLGVDVTEVQAHGICMYGTNDNFMPPFVKLTASTVTSVAPTSFSVYSMTVPTTMPPTFVAQNDSPIGIHGIYSAANSMVTTVTINATADSSANSTNTYSAFPCDVIPNFITFGPENPDQNQ